MSDTIRFFNKPSELTATAISMTAPTAAMAAVGVYYWRMAWAAPVLNMRAMTGLPVVSDDGVMDIPTKAVKPVKSAVKTAQPTKLVTKKAAVKKAEPVMAKVNVKKTVAKPKAAETQAKIVSKVAAPKKAAKVDVKKPATEIYQAKSSSGAKKGPVTLAAMPNVKKVDNTKPALLKVAKNGKADDLKLIKGVGPKLEKQLNALGIYHFDQVASWNDKQVGWIDDQLDAIKGMPMRDKWVTQAKSLVKNK
ncbi:hypothetical protein [Parasulfitobacter algicola]|uniref:NADH dehydrogenase subunit E n=1 Tax=Parasulfitobacter algicola TaxID=2614809 RepID=A0ABX2IWN8_9RHOB|nr:hypothetical protein [Sulfitobacter algicola]NSX54518.1 hypothetical protein [Sulfitobacter algicola]